VDGNAIRRSLSAPAAAGAPFSGPAPDRRPFDFTRDTFAFANETVWRYGVDAASGRQTTARKDQIPAYTLRCFVLARSVKQFFLHARFDPSATPPEESTARRLIRAVVSRGARELDSSRVESPIVIPGYADLRSFSQAGESWLKAECGGHWQSYLQRGNWRLVFPLTRGHQEREAHRLLATVASGRLAVVHIVRFPQLTINHALVAYRASESSDGITFNVYDPNIPERPLALEFVHSSRTFHLPATHYFVGGRVDLYEIYRGWTL